MVGKMPYLKFLGRLHAVQRPATYLQIGIRSGSSLALSRSRSIGIDPDFVIECQITCDVSLFRMTSDEYFARPEPLAPLRGAPVDLAFIDGLHLLEFVLRDFIHVEDCSSPSSVVVVKGVLPRTVEEATRERQSRAWTGDVYKIVDVLRQYRPDLTLLLVDTRPTGLLLVMGLDPGNTVLTDRYEEIVEKYVVDDPQDVPPEILAREAALEPEKLLRSPVWGALHRGRRPWASRKRTRAEMTDALEHPDTYRARRRQLRRTASRTLRRAVRQARAVRSR